MPAGARPRPPSLRLSGPYRHGGPHAAAHGAAPPARQASLRRHNLALVLREVAAGGPLSRAELSRRTGLTKASVSTMVDSLTSCGVLEELSSEGSPRPGPGRPGSPVGFGPTSPVAIGLEVAVGYTSACVVDLAGRCSRQSLLVLDNRALGPAAGMQRAARLVAELARSVRDQGRRLLGCGLAVPGVVGPSGELWWVPNMATWAGLHPAQVLDDLLQEHMGGAVLTGPGGLVADAGTPGDGLRALAVGNEANLGALAELWYGGHRHLEDFLRVSGEVGVGAGIVSGGRLLTGARGAAGELGHVNVEPEGLPCACGARGCLEQYAGQEAIVRQAGALGYGQVLDMAARGEPSALLALEEAGRALGLAVAATLNVVDVPTVVLGGIYAELAPYIQAALARQLAERVVGGRFGPVRVVAAGVGREAAMRGAGGVVAHQVVADPAAHLPELLDRSA